MRPQRIQLRRTKGWRKPDGAIVVARPTKWGNPFTVGQDITDYVLGWRRALEDLRGHDLACWCPLDQLCHADVLLGQANAVRPRGWLP